MDGVTEKKNSGKKIRKTHGTKAAEVGLSLDNAMRANFNGIGLDLFAVGKELFLTDPFLWPRGQVNLDEGSGLTSVTYHGQKGERSANRTASEGLCQSL